MGEAQLHRPPVLRRAGSLPVAEPSVLGHDHTPAGRLLDTPLHPLYRAVGFPQRHLYTDQPVSMMKMYYPLKLFNTWRVAYLYIDQSVSMIKMCCPLKLFNTWRVAYLYIDQSVSMIKMCCPLKLFNTWQVAYLYTDQSVSMMKICNSLKLFNN